MNTLHPLIVRLHVEHGYPLLDSGGLEAFSAAAGDTILFCTGDPAQHPECLDVAVVLPELLRAFPGRFRAGIVARDLEPDMQTRYGFTRWPTLVFLRDGAYVGALSGIQDWSVYLGRIQELLVAPARRPPSIGITVHTAAAATTCH
ncbi:MAG TPA: hydrogenase [Thiobacillaceae bacterium]|nr:hydrogenase [Thiobacillaceae bacterium]HNU63323.1 hydrogenase [Thiobacillaceae bacterium]